VEPNRGRQLGMWFAAIYSGERAVPESPLDIDGEAGGTRATVNATDVQLADDQHATATRC
jgi:hypothetical protein